MSHGIHATTGEHTLSTPRLVISRNTGTRRTLCALCNTRRDFTLGLELFRIDTMELVCWPCGKEHAPDLVALLALGWTASNFTWEHNKAQELSIAPRN
jgi:hypothetical protein